jgi:anti-sigma factor RsiW
MRLTCQQVTDVIIDYLMESMAPATRLAFEAHLSRCTDCEAFLNTYRETIRTTRSVQYETVPKEMLNRIEQFLRGKMTPPPAS